MVEQDNSQEICRNRPQSECVSCSISERLDCRFQLKSSLRFLAAALIFVIPAFIGVIFAGYTWFLLGWIVYMIFFLQVWENRILCSHCPFYAEKGKTLRCNANYGLWKLWKYKPGPMSGGEKIQFIIGIIIFIGYPFPFLILGKEYLLLAISILGALVLTATLLKGMCVRCLNFSCPLNRVPKDVVDAFLLRNPVMRKAWEEKGYRITTKKDSSTIS